MIGRKGSNRKTEQTSHKEQMCKTQQGPHLVVVRHSRAFVAGRLGGLSMGKSRLGWACTRRLLLYLDWSWDWPHDLSVIATSGPHQAAHGLMP